MSNMSYKHLIQRYIVLKINAKEWLPNTKIPSENKLAMKFKCSRLTARAALQPLVCAGVLYVRPGGWYAVSEASLEPSLRSFAVSHNVIQKICTITNMPWLKQQFQIPMDANAVSLVKSYYDQAGLLAVQFTLLNKNFLWDINRHEIQDSITKFLAMQGVIIKYSNIIVKLASSKMYDVIKIGKKLGWENIFPIEIISSYTQEGWIEKTIRITRANVFEVCFTKRNYL